MKQYQTLQVFKGKRPAAHAGPNDQARGSTMYGKISAKKDMEKLEAETKRAKAAAAKAKPLNKKLAKALYLEYEEIEGI